MYEKPKKDEIAKMYRMYIKPKLDDRPIMAEKNEKSKILRPAA